MRLELPRRVERFGAVRINELQRVIELDGGRSPEPMGSVYAVPADAINAVERDLVIVVPCMNETRSVIEGVLSGIPHDCLIVLVSNSDRMPVDRFDMELHTLRQYCRAAGRAAVAVHQRDPGLAGAMKAAGLPDLIDDEGLVRTGKGEGMLIGMALAAMSGRRYVGYVDADNYVPGAVNEYCKAFAAGLHLAETPYAMVRIFWHSKPKLRDGRLFFSRRGRTSEVTNQFINRLIAEYSGFGTDLVATGNSGEHALSLDLGLRMRLGGGFAVEPFEFVDLFEQFGGMLEPGDPDVMSNLVSITQIETRNPHFHADKGDEHVQGMRMQALNVLYHSPVCLPAVREAIVEFLLAQGALLPGEEPPRERFYPPVGTLALDRLFDVLGTEADTFHQVEVELHVLTRAAAPIDRDQVPTPRIPPEPLEEGSLAPL
jgi:mannosyl-3-phosphoglycerate synthase